MSGCLRDIPVQLILLDITIVSLKYTAFKDNKWSNCWRSYSTIEDQSVLLE